MSNNSLNHDFSPPTQEDISIPKTKPSVRYYQKNDDGRKRKTAPSENVYHDEGNGEYSNQENEESEYDEIGQPSPAVQTERMYFILEEEKEKEGNRHSILNQPAHYSVLWAEKDLFEPNGVNDYSTLEYH